MSNLNRLLWRTKALWALLASFATKEWTFDDYPVRVRFQPPLETPGTSRLKPIPWSAAILNWPGIVGFGNTKTEALKDLREKFNQYKAATGKLPRPGAKVPIEFASMDRVEPHQELAKTFLRQIVGVEWAFITDESSLWDFHHDETNDELIGKIRQVYGVDVSDIPSGNLADIFDKISRNKSIPN